MKHLCLLLLLVLMAGAALLIPESENMTDFAFELSTAITLSFLGGGLALWHWRKQENG